MTLADFFKFLPGWLAFVFTVGAGVQRWRVRRHKLAIGSDDDAAREQLTRARSVFEDIKAYGGKRSLWFLDEERRDVGQLVRDLAERRKDRALRDAMNRVADAWDQAFAQGLPERVMLSFGGDEPTPQERADSDQDLTRTQLQIEAAHAGIEHIKTAIDRLNELERETHGRS